MLGPSLTLATLFLEHVQSCFEALKAGADSKRKLYGCVVWVSKSLTQADVETLNAITGGASCRVHVYHSRTLE